MHAHKLCFLSLLLLIFACSEEPKSLLKRDLTAENWEFRQSDDTVWRLAKVPGVVQSDLLRHNLIPHPWKGTNEDKIQWIEEKNWVYRCSFKIDNSELDIHK